MTGAALKCHQCRRATSVRVVESLSGKEAPLTLTLHGLPIQVCAKGHRHFPHAKLAAHFLLRLAGNDAAGLPVSGEKGIWFKHAVCVDCGAEVEKGRGRPHTFRVEVPIPQAAALEIDLTLPVHRCRACGKEQLRSRKLLQDRSPGAFLCALRAAGIAGE